VLAVALAVALLVAQQVVEMPGIDRIARGLNNGLHGCWFALVTWLVLTTLETVRPGAAPRATLAIAAAIAIVLALGTELVQVFTARSAGLFDAAMNLLGAGAAACFWAARRGLLPRRRGIAAAAAMIFVSLAPLSAALAVDLYRETIAPDLVRPDSPLYPMLLQSNSEVSRVPAPDDWPEYAGHRVLRVELADERWPGVVVSETLSDWTDYRTLEVDTFVPGEGALPLSVSVRFWRHRERHAFRTFDVAPGASRIRIELDDLFDRETMRVSDVVVYSRRWAAGRTFYLGGIRLL